MTVRRVQRRIREHLAVVVSDQSGVALIALVFALGIAALVAVSTMLLRGTGVQEQLAETKNNSGAFDAINSAIVLHVLQDPTYLLPCPADGSASDGLSVVDCSSPPENVGTVPWATLGLSPQAALDGYGNKIVYAMSAGPLEACETSGGVATGNVSTGTLDAGEDLGSSSPYLYVLVSHGPNGLGAFNAAGNARPAPTNNDEDENCAFGSSCSPGTTSFIDTGPFNPGGEPATVFDDEFFYSSANDYSSECLNFVP